LIILKIAKNKIIDEIEIEMLDEIIMNENNLIYYLKKNESR